MKIDSGVSVEGAWDRKEYAAMDGKETRERSRNDIRVRSTDPIYGRRYTPRLNFTLLIHTLPHCSHQMN
jgi:hypothetical protein